VIATSPPPLVAPPDAARIVRLGAPAGGYILDDRHRRTAQIRYRLGADAADGPWVKVTFRVTLRLDQHLAPNAFGEVEALTDGLPSASIELSRAPGGGVRWTAAGLHSGGDGVAHRPRLRIAYSNYVRTQASGRGTHTLAFRYVPHRGFRLPAARIEAGTGVSLTRQPPQALRVGRAAVRAVPPSLDHLEIQLKITNVGHRTARGIGVQWIDEGDGLQIAGPRRASVLRAGASQVVTLDAVGSRDREHHVKVLASSSVGQDVADVIIPVPRRPPPTGDRGSASADGGRFAWGPAGASVVAAGLLLLAARAVVRRRRRV
jgi:hypothetical protein